MAGEALTGQSSNSSRGAAWAVLRYLAACAASGALVGPAFGAFARARFHYPWRYEDVPLWHQAVLEALAVVEWPAFFALTLAAALALWRWLRPRRRPAAAWRAGRSAALLFALLAAAALVIVVPATRWPGRVLSAAVSLALAGLATTLLLRLHAEARAVRTGLGGRYVAQLPVACGHLAATLAASVSLGYRGENALMHGIALAIGIALFVAELVLALPIAVLAGYGSLRMTSTSVTMKS